MKIIRPKMTPTQRIAFAILCALEIYKNKEYGIWAEKWLSGEDRTEQAARTAARIAWVVGCGPSYTEGDGENVAWVGAKAALKAAEMAAKSPATLDFSLLTEKALKIT